MVGGMSSEGVLRKLSMPLLGAEECRKVLQNVTGSKILSESNSFLCGGVSHGAACYVSVSLSGCGTPLHSLSLRPHPPLPLSYSYSSFSFLSLRPLLSSLLLFHVPDFVSIFTYHFCCLIFLVLLIWNRNKLSVEFVVNFNKWNSYFSVEVTLYNVIATWDFFGKGKFM